MKKMKNNQSSSSIFSRAYILGGSPCSGKSTVAEKLSNQFHLQYYKVDDHYQDHVKQCNPDQHPTMYKVSNMGWNEIWSRPVSILVSEEFEYSRELFKMIVQDLLQFDAEKPIIVEGAALLPEVIKEKNIDPKKVLYLVPTKEFQIHHYSQREFIHHILKDCLNPEQAFENWMMRDHLFGQEILHQAASLGFGTIVVDGQRAIDAQIEYVRNYFDIT